MEVLLNVANGIGLVQGMGVAAGVRLDYVQYESEVLQYAMLRPEIDKAEAARLIAQWYYNNHNQLDVWQLYNDFIRSSY